MWSSEAPSNVALIKYMGKQNGNVPCNVSLSHVLNKFITKITIENCLKEDKFASDIVFDQRSIDRFLYHLKNIKKHLGYNGFFYVKSSNNFPHSSGIASSASSFAALTKCAFAAICEIKCIVYPSIEEMSQMSRIASGSSCRSFFSPWCVWNGEHAKKIDLKIGELHHDLALVNKNPKEISSSEAHRLVKTSLLFEGRAQRAEKRFENLVNCLNTSDWSNAYQICWEEFCDMHALFETSSTSFGYFQPETILTLNIIRHFWKLCNDGPIVTIDAGPNVHILWRKDQNELSHQLKKMIIAKNSSIDFL